MKCKTIPRSTRCTSVSERARVRVGIEAVREARSRACNTAFALEPDFDAGRASICDDEVRTDTRNTVRPEPIEGIRRDLTTWKDRVDELRTQCKVMAC